MLAQTIHIIAYLLVILSILVGIFLVPLSLPGTWLIAIVSILYSFFYKFDGGATSAWWVVGWLLGLAAFGEVMEFVVGTFGSKAVKVSNGAIIAAFIGGIIGLIVGVPVFLVGSLIGLFVGAFLAALIYEWIVEHSFLKALRVAAAVLATRMVASVLKTTLAVGMGIFLLFKIF